MNQKTLFKLSKYTSEHGGVFAIGKRKSRRPLSLNLPHHFTLKADTQKTTSLIRQRNFISNTLTKFAKRFQVKIHNKSINSNHCHLLISFKSRSSYLAFIRATTASIALKTKTKWAQIPYSKIIHWGREFKNVWWYIDRNSHEALGVTAYRRAPRVSIPLRRVDASTDGEPNSAQELEKTSCSVENEGLSTYQNRPHWLSGTLNRLRLGPQFANTTRMRKILLLALVCAVLSGCGDGNDRPPGPAAYGEGQALAKLSQVTCDIDDESKCISAALFVRAVSHYSNFGCSSFIAGEISGRTVMATNRHCLGDISTNKQCQEKVGFSFAKAQGYAADIAGCSRILKMSKEQNTSAPDFAFILLDRKISRPALKMTSNGVENGELYDVIHLDINHSDGSAKIRKTSCEAVMNSIIVMDYIADTSPRVALYGCGLIKGNSGSAVLNQSGEVTSILQAGAADKNRVERHQKEDSEYREITKNFDLTQSNIATNLACIDFPALGLNPIRENACQRRVDPRKIDRASLDDALKQYERESIAWLNSQDLIIAPKIKTVVHNDFPERMEISTRPFCFISPQQGSWLRKYKRKYWFGYESTAVEKIPFLSWQITKEIDDHARPRFFISTTKRLISISFNPNDLYNNGSTKVTVQNGQGLVSSSSLTIKFCTEADYKNLNE